VHRSKLAGFIIDCRTDDLPGAANFWSGALGMPMCETPGSEGESYRRLHDSQLGLSIEVQRVDHPSRVHLDIEADDIEAEVRRLEALGARRVAQIKTWWIMEAPTGQRFCVIRAASPRFMELATTWP
jgi:hypothetical protein